MKLRRILSIVLLCVLLCTAVPLQGMALHTDDFQVIISMEGLTLGQGFYVTPTKYTMDEINALLAPQGFGPFTKRNLTVAMATLAMLRDKNLTAHFNARWDKNIAYLTGVEDIDKGTVNIPAVITQNGGPSNRTVRKNADRSLDEMDYTDQSGWMVTVNDFMISDNIAKFGLENNNTPRNKGFQDYGNTYVIRWQFTLWGYGLDLGFKLPGWDATPYFTHANKDALYAAYATGTDADAKAKLLPVMENLTAARTEVDAALDAYEHPAQPEPEQLNFFQRLLAFFRNLLRKLFPFIK
ncbi:MAG: hypothetical protein IKN72_06565 [Clostridia bacterium]|nr:hypothetical protein [Clostridia bacterium]